MSQKSKCPCCGYYTKEGTGDFEICPVCYWEDDPAQRRDETLAEGANKVCLKKARENFIEFGACEQWVLKYVREPLEEEMRKQRYVLQKSAGIYWLIDSEQEGVPFRKPLRMNEMGATIWNLKQEGYSVSEIVANLQKEYDADEAVLKRDVEVFMAELLLYESGKVSRV